MEIQDFSWFRVDNLEPVLLYGYPSYTEERMIEVDVFDEPEHPISVICSKLRERLGKDLLDNKIVIGYKRKDTGETIYVGWKDSYCSIGLSAKNKDGAEPTCPWIGRLIYTGVGGTDHDKKTANKYLRVDYGYTLEYKIVNDWSTQIYLKEIQDKFPSGSRVYFNSVMFREHGEDESTAEFVERVHPNFEQLKAWENARKS